MGAGKMHADEVGTDADLVRRLIAGQFPRWAGLPVEPVESAGTVNAVYRLGPDMAVRLPRTEGGAKDVEAEARWLPALGRALPVAIPLPLAKGVPAEGFPWPWSVHTWLNGENPAPGRVAEPDRLAKDLAEFLSALWSLDPADGPPAYRSEPLAARDGDVRWALGELEGEVDVAAATALWDRAAGTPEWLGPRVWVHADLSPGNVLLDAGRLSAVIDFGCVGLGDPAVDLIGAWSLLPAASRQVFRNASGVDAATWLRGRGWALSIALVEAAYYRTGNPVIAATARHVIREVLLDGPAG